MNSFGRPQVDRPGDVWKSRLDRFAREHQFELAALAWGFFCDCGNKEEVLGIDLQPTPHFISCSWDAISQLNRNVNGQLQEVLGIWDGYNPEKEVLFVAIGEGDIKLINFAPAPPPPACFEEIAEDIATLLDRLEERLVKAFADVG